MPRRSHSSLRRDKAAGDRRVAAGDNRDRDDGGGTPLGGRTTQSTREGDYLVRSVPGAGAQKPYRCPGCRQTIGVGTAHVVVWPADDPSWIETAVDARRHWHPSCWRRWATKGGPNAPA